MTGDTLSARVEDGVLILMSPETAVRKAQELVRRYIPEGVSLVDELIAERRAEAGSRNRSMTVVLDASAVLAVLNSEPGGDKVSGHLSGGLMSAVNAVEVGTRLVDAGMTPDDASVATSLLGMTIVDFDETLPQ